MYTYRNPITEIGDYSNVVPFNREFFMAEAVLASDDVLEPLFGSAASIANKEPIPGATAIYVLTGNGVNEPSFSSDFLPVTGYGYDKTAGAVNTIVMWYDGSDFLYKVLRETIQPVEPFLGKDQWVGDFGLGAGVISLVIGGNPLLVDLRPTQVPGVGAVEISAFDIIKSVHYTGAGPLIYEMTRAGDPPVINEDPKLAVVALECADAGGPPIGYSIRVYEDGGPTSQTYNVTVQVTDSFFACVIP